MVGDLVESHQSNFSLMYEKKTAEKCLGMLHTVIVQSPL